MKGVNLLIEEPPLQVLPSLAKLLGLNPAIFLQQLHYWINNKKTEGTIKDGHKWIYNTYEEWQVNFPFWSVRTIQRIALDLENREILISEQLDKSTYDRKKFYRIDYDKLAELFGTGCQYQEPQVVTIDSAKVARSLNESETTTENTSYINKKENLKKEIASKGGLDWQVLGGTPSEEVESLNKTFALRKEKTDEYERAMNYPPLPWGDKELAKLERHLQDKTPEDIRTFAKWSKNPYNGLSPAKARQHPHLVIDLWNQAFTEDNKPINKRAQLLKDLEEA